MSATCAPENILRFPRAAGMPPPAVVFVCFPELIFVIVRILFVYTFFIKGFFLLI